MLRDALDEMLAGKPVTKTGGAAFGCTIKRRLRVSQMTDVRSQQRLPASATASIEFRSGLLRRAWDRSCEDLRQGAPFYMDPSAPPSPYGPRPRHVLQRGLFRCFDRQIKNDRALSPQRSRSSLFTWVHTRKSGHRIEGQRFLANKAGAEGTCTVPATRPRFTSPALARRRYSCSRSR